MDVDALNRIFAHCVRTLERDRWTDLPIEQFKFVLASLYYQDPPFLAQLFLV